MLGGGGGIYIIVTVRPTRVRKSNTPETSQRRHQRRVSSRLVSQRLASVSQLSFKETGDSKYTTACTL